MWSTAPPELAQASLSRARQRRFEDRVINHEGFDADPASHCSRQARVLHRVSVPGNATGPGPDGKSECSSHRSFREIPLDTTAASVYTHVCFNSCLGVSLACPSSTAKALIRRPPRPL